MNPSILHILPYIHQERFDFLRAPIKHSSEERHAQSLQSTDKILVIPQS